MTTSTIELNEKELAIIEAERAKEAELAIIEAEKKQKEIASAISNNKRRVETIKSKQAEKVEKAKEYFNCLKAIDDGYKFVLTPHTEKFVAVVFNYDNYNKLTTSEVVDTIEFEIVDVHIIYEIEKVSDNDESKWVISFCERKGSIWMALQSGWNWKTGYYKSAKTIDGKIKDAINSIRYRNNEKIQHNKLMELAKNYASNKYNEASVEIVRGSHEYVQAKHPNGLTIKVYADEYPVGTIRYSEQIDSLSALDSQSVIDALIKIPKKGN